MSRYFDALPTPGDASSSYAGGQYFGSSNNSAMNPTELQDRERDRKWMFDEIHCSPRRIDQIGVFKLLVEYTLQPEIISDIVTSMNLANLTGASAYDRAVQADERNNDWGIDTTLINVQNLANTFRFCNRIQYVINSSI